ncbi:sulfotransferase family 2 domain-containing protein [Metabacillus fastidiosus]|uniref:sulfotransferase family 2 domain-containing protein n=1 Tax=Metabacillus fastidiosus TaxID=1458 RepID=UPI003D268FE3
MSEKRIPIFVHIPKTAGSTLRSILKNQYDPNVICFGNQQEMTSKLENFSEEEMEQIKCLHGHFHFGIHQHLSDRPYTYYTMLRDPVEHVISEYYYILRKPNNQAHDKVKNMSFEEFIISEEFHDRTSNRQTFFISGGLKDDLDLALKNLNQYFSIVGITEMFDESIFFIGQELGWKNITYKKKNVTKNRPSKDEFPDNIIKLIEEKNELDMELYNFSKNLLQTKIKNLNHQSMRKLRHYIQMQEKINRNK